MIFQHPGRTRIREVLRTGRNSRLGRTYRDPQVLIY